MAKKKTGSRGRSKEKTRTQREHSDPEDLPMLGSLAMDAFLSQLLPGDQATPDTPLGEAQALVQQAYETDSDEQVALAQRALSICGDCADAYILLADNAESIEDAIHLYREAFAAGERALGEEGFREYAGHFWGFIETRPYMRARMNLAQVLWSARRLDEAVEHYQGMLQLNPDDNQGIRYEMAACLIELGRDDELRDLLAQYEEDGTAAWAYSTALLAFRVVGDSAEAVKQLVAAQKINPHVPAYLLGVESIPQQLPTYVGLGDENEAISYAATFLPGWKSTPGAIHWLRSHAEVGLPRPQRRRPAWGRLKHKYAALPQCDEVWQVDVRKTDQAAGKSSSASMWIALIVADTDKQPLYFDVSTDRPDDAELWDALLNAMNDPGFGDRRRPQRVEVRLKSLCNQWRSKLRGIGVDCVHCPELEELDVAFEIAAKADNMSRTVEQNRELAATISEDDLASLPQRPGEVWQADFRQLASWIDEGGSPFRPWMLMVTNRDDELIIAQDMSSAKPEAEAFLQQLALAMARPHAGEPHRPGMVQVNSEEKQQLVSELLDRLGINCVVSDQLDQIDFLFDELSQHLAGDKGMPALLDVPGLQAEQIGSFFDAAARFYDAAPWRSVPGDTPIKIVCPKFETGTWYAVIMGQSGMTLGIALYEDLTVLESMLTGRGSDEENARKTSAISMSFGEAFEIAPRDLDAVERYGWPIAGPEAYPSALRVSPGGNIRPPLAWELAILEASLRGVLEFVRGGGELQTLEFETAAGTMTVELEWVE